MSNPNWWNDAACAGQPINLFFPEKGEKHKILKAKAFCKNCTVTVQCLQDTLKAEDPTTRPGVFGGLSSSERKIMFGSMDHGEVRAGEMREHSPSECAVV